MPEKIYMSMEDVQQALAGISKSTLRRRIKDLNLKERGYIFKLGRRLLFSSSLITDLPALLCDKKEETLIGYNK